MHLTLRHKILAIWRAALTCFYVIINFADLGLNMEYNFLYDNLEKKYYHSRHGTLDQRSYRVILEHTMLPFAREAFQDTFVFQQDNAQSVADYL